MAFVNISKDLENKGYLIELIDGEDDYGKIVDSSRINIPKLGLKNLKKIINMVLESNTKIGEGCTLNDDGLSPNLD